MDEATRILTYACIDYEIVGIPQSVEPSELVTEIFESMGALIVDHENVLRWLFRGSRKCSRSCRDCPMANST